MQSRVALSNRLDEEFASGENDNGTDAGSAELRHEGVQYRHEGVQYRPEAERHGKCTLVLHQTSARTSLMLCQNFFFRLSLAANGSLGRVARTRAVPVDMTAIYPLMRQPRMG